ncbi:MAG TPA: hypothetical protein VJ974_02805 [Geopsychrobacteraceae bacterium]|nr:hypothetical protein [Geopsychrobacteraceae bacterium]
MQNKILTAGDDIEARCTKCRKNTNHTIVAMTEEVPAKVQCNTCDGQHKFRPPTVPKKPAVRRTVDPKAVEKKEWEELVPPMNSAKATDYSMTGTFKVKSLINHPKFGLGLVQRIAGSQKVEVLFEDGKKTLRCK